MTDGNQRRRYAKQLPSFRARVDRTFTSLFLLLAFLMLLPLCRTAAAQDLQIGQMVHTSWTAREGAPQQIEALAQASDGSLWIGAAGGLYRFDGLSFTRFRSPVGEPAFPSVPVCCLLAQNDGTLWVGTLTGGLVRIRDGHVKIIKDIDGELFGSINELLQGPDGSLWGLAQYRPIHLGPDHQLHWADLSPKLRKGETTSLFLDSRKTLWIVQAHNLYSLPHESQNLTTSAVRLGVQPHFAEDTSGRLWVTDLFGSPLKGRLVELGRNWARPQRMKLSAGQNWLFADSGGALWISRDGIGLSRLRFSPTTADGEPPTRAIVSAFEDDFGLKEGLSSATVTTLLRDAQGNIWAGGHRGLDRFQQPALVPLQLRAPNGELLAVDTDASGTMWIGVPAVGLFSMHGDTLHREYGRRDYLGVFSGTQDTIWFDDDAGLWTLQQGRSVFKRKLFPAGSTAIFKLVQKSSGVAFASLLDQANPSQNGVFQIINKRWTKIAFSRGEIDLSDPRRAKAIARIDQVGPTTQFIDSHQRLWNGYSSGLISTVDGESTRLLSSGTPGLGMVLCFLETSDGILAAGANGVAVWRGKSFEMLHFQNDDVATGISGFVQARNGDLWLNGRLGIASISLAELRSALKSQQHPIATNLVTEGDFVGPAPVQLRHKTAFSDGVGRLWFFGPDGTLLRLDLEHMAAPPLPQLSILHATADDVPLRPERSVAPRPHIISIKYFGIDLSIPEKVTYRYQLKGVDASWQNVGHRTEAIYTDLRPGRYTFQVQASNGNGDWTSIVSGLPFTIQPSFYQTAWFGICCATAGLVLIWLVFSLRLSHLAARARERADERADERIRIARDLHDTLLQGVQILLLTFQTVTDRISADPSSRELLHRAVSRAEIVIAEGRSQVKRLRSAPSISEDLASRLQQLGQELNKAGASLYEVEQRGTTRELRPAVAEEMYYIAREAVTNSFRHSGATAILVELKYSQAGFYSTCKDNGHGFDYRAFCATPQAEHWGLRGMAERAGSIGASFSCESRPGQGTQVTLALSSRSAYCDQSGLVFRLMRSLRRDTTKADLAATTEN